MIIKLLSYDQDPDTLCAAVGHLSRDKGVASEVLARYRENPQKSGNVLSRILSMGHRAVAEHAVFTVAFDEVPVTVEWFMIQFRLGSYLVKSRRYVDYRKAGYEIPDLPEKFLPEFDKYCHEMFETYGKLVDLGSSIYGHSFVEDARFVLPYSFHSSFFCTMNARELAHCLYQALYGWGSKSPTIRKAGKLLLEQLQAVAPRLFDLKNLEKASEKKQEILADFPSVSFSEKKAPVELWSATEDADLITALSYLFEETLAPRGQMQAWLQESPNRLDKVVQQAVKDPRPRALEQVNFQFRINDVSWSSLTHFARHRMYSPIFPGLEKSCDNKHWIFPETIRQNEELSEIYQAAWKRASQFSDFLIENQVPPVLRVPAGLSGNLTSFVANFNARELFVFFRLRCCQNAQHEIRHRAEEMLRLAREKAPRVFATAGPACFSEGACSEGPNSCGKAREIIQRYQATNFELSEMSI